MGQRRRRRRTVDRVRGCRAGSRHDSTDRPVSVGSKENIGPTKKMKFGIFKEATVHSSSLVQWLCVLAAEFISHTPKEHLASSNTRTSSASGSLCPRPRAAAVGGRPCRPRLGGTRAEEGRPENCPTSAPTSRPGSRAVRPADWRPWSRSAFQKPALGRRRRRFASPAFSRPQAPRCASRFGRPRPLRTNVTVYLLEIK